MSANVLALQQATRDWNNYVTSGLYQGDGNMSNANNQTAPLQVFELSNGDVVQVSYGANLVVRARKNGAWTVWGLFL
ncbi:pyocin knob domain-containing protein [Lactococcus protaetiae]|uniref:Uncharacterized protein n=1 Tax=Lactococcus protaetiae TaxID=2592653 RepID=A0A514Z712_9LACT|nr:pyocin knob domain-containing protein [Lactococcus protaetiae]QDK70343.1 hypothetical protein FLP15_03135 [Lactococcus protaetiae]